MVFPSRTLICYSPLPHPTLGRGWSLNFIQPYLSDCLHPVCEPGQALLLVELPDVEVGVAELLSHARQSPGQNGNFIQMRELGVVQ